MFQTMRDDDIPGFNKPGLLKGIKENLFNSLLIILLNSKTVVVTTQVRYLQGNVSGVVPIDRKYRSLIIILLNSKIVVVTTQVCYLQGNVSGVVPMDRKYRSLIYSYDKLNIVQ